MGIVIKMSSRSFFLRERQTRKSNLLKLIEKNPGATLNRLKGAFSLKTGLTFKKIDEYLSELEASGLIEISDDDENLKTVKPVER